MCTCWALHNSSDLRIGLDLAVFISCFTLIGLFITAAINPDDRVTCGPLGLIMLLNSTVTNIYIIILLQMLPVNSQGFFLVLGGGCVFFFISLWSKPRGLFYGFQECKRYTPTDVEVIWGEYRTGQQNQHLNGWIKNSRRVFHSGWW